MRAMSLHLRKKRRLAFAVALLVRTHNSIDDARIILQTIGSSPEGLAYLAAETGRSVSAEALHRSIARLVHAWVRTVLGAREDGRVARFYTLVPRSPDALPGSPDSYARSFALPVRLAVGTWIRDPRTFDASRLLALARALQAPATAPCPPPPHASRDGERDMLLASAKLWPMLWYAARRLSSFVLSASEFTVEQRTTWQRIDLPLLLALSVDGVSLARGHALGTMYEAVSLMNLLLGADERRQPQNVRIIALLSCTSGGSDAARRRKRVAFSEQFRVAVTNQLIDVFRNPLVFTDVWERTIFVVQPLVAVLSGDHLAMSAALGSSSARCSCCAVQKANLRDVIPELPPPRSAAEVQAARDRYRRLPPRAPHVHISDEERAAEAALVELGVWPEVSALEELEREYGSLLGPAGFWDRLVFAILHTLYLGPNKDSIGMLEGMIKRNGKEAAAIERVAAQGYYTDGVRIIHTFPNYPNAGDIPGVQHRDLLLALYTAIGDVPGLLPADGFETVVRTLEAALELIALVRRDTLSVADRASIGLWSSRFVRLFPEAFDEALRVTLTRPGAPKLERPKLHFIANELRRSIENFESPNLISDATFEQSYKQHKSDFERTKRDRLAGAAVLTHALKRMWWASDACLLFQPGERGAPEELGGTRPVLDLTQPHSVAAVGADTPLKPAASGHSDEIIAAISSSWSTFYDSLPADARSRYYGKDLHTIPQPHKHGARINFRAWVYHAAAEMWGTVVALPRGAPGKAHAAGGGDVDGGVAAARSERFDFVEMILDPAPVGYRALAQLCAIFTVPTRSGGADGGPGREAFVLVRYLTKPQTVAPAGGILLAYNERRYFANSLGNPAAPGSRRLYVAESLESVSRSWPVRPRIVTRGAVDNVSDGFFAPKKL